MRARASATEQYALTRRSQDGGTRPQLLRSEDVRKAALTAFAELVERADAAAIDTVAARLEDTDGHVRLAAVNALQQVAGRGDANAIAAVASRLDHAASETRYAAVSAFA